MTRLLIVITYLVLVFYGYVAFKDIFKNRPLRAFYFILTLGVFIYFSINVLLPGAGIRNNPEKLRIFAIFFSFYLLVVIMGGLMLLQDIKRGLIFLVRRTKAPGDGTHLPQRRKFVSKVALFLGTLPFGSLLYSIFHGRYNFRVIKYTLEFNDLPDAFNGYQITHISDIHCGGLDNREKVAYAVDLINRQESDAIFFTGDIIDRTTDELDEWKDLFSKLKAKDGIFSILGNHDYGDYIQWDSEEDKKNSFEKLKRYQKEMGFKLLCNENQYLHRNDGRLAVIGLENWSASSKYMQKGDFEKSLNGIDKTDFKIAMTHDPTHWEHKIINHKEHIHLTLSGHTHGYQFGIEVPGYVKWSPFVADKYKYWAGLYEELGQYINVNRGFGCTAFPGRIGIWPEISVIILKKKGLRVRLTTEYSVPNNYNDKGED